MKKTRLIVLTSILLFVTLVAAQDSDIPKPVAFSFMQSINKNVMALEIKIDSGTYNQQIVVYADVVKSDGTNKKIICASVRNEYINDCSDAEKDNNLWKTIRPVDKKVVLNVPLNILRSYKDDIDELGVYIYVVPGCVTDKDGDRNFDENFSPKTHCDMNKKSEYYYIDLGKHREIVEEYLEEAQISGCRVIDNNRNVFLPEKCDFTEKDNTLTIKIETGTPEMPITIER